MPAFAAINLEPEESIDEEVDTTKELQVDDALKLFQNALKLHAQGPRFFNEASDAYDALFRSEIFKYPEAVTEYERSERQQDPFALELSFPTGLDVTGTDPDGTGSSLPQAFYLSYKNHGQFILDRIRHKARTAGPSADEVFESPEVREDAGKALYDFTAALDRDPSDAELWRRTARTAAFLKSVRASRYCLESAIELDDDPVIVDVEPPSLAEGFAGEQLKSQLEVLSDNMALSHPIMGPYVRRELPSLLKRFLDPAPFLPNPTTELAIPKPPYMDRSLAKVVIDVPNMSWADLGMALVQFINEQGFLGQALDIQLPESMDEDEDLVQMEIDKQLQAADDTAKSTDEVAVASPVEVPEQPKDIKVASKDTKAAADAPAPENPRRSVSIPSRKRSVSVAGLQDGGDEEGGDTKRSKRTRRRDTATVEEVVDETTLRANQLQPYQGADQNLFQLTKNILENLGVTDKATVAKIGEIIDSCAAEERTSKVTDQPSIDLRDTLASYDEGNAKILLNKKEPPALGLNAFLEHTKSGSQHASDTPTFDERSGLHAFVKKLNSAWSTAQDAAFEWVRSISKDYESKKWSDHMKTAVVQVISRFDEAIYERTNFELDRLHRSQKDENLLSELDCMIQMLFELYLDVYERITNPNSVVDYAIRVETKGRLGRWLDLASELSRSRQGDKADESLSLRFLWACVFSTTLSQEVDADHILRCWTSLRDFLANVGSVDIYLPNNAVIPEISPAAADREISKMTTMDFFLTLFQEEMTDPVSVIDTLEPVLNPDSVFVTISKAKEVNGDKGDSASKTTKVPIAEVANQGLRDLWKFLLNSSTDLRLFLWSRLSDAYGAIKYTTKQFSCLLKSIEMVVADLDHDTYKTAPQEARKTLLLKLIKSIDDLMVSALSLALNDNSAFDIIDEEHIRSTSAALAKHNCLLHIAAMFEDEVRFGICQSPSNSSTYQQLVQKLREMQVRTWSLQYTMLKVGIHQNQTIFKTPDNDLAEYLNAVHQVLGLRKACKASNKIFLRMMRIELLKQKNIENWEDYLGQVLYDLHGLKLGVGVWEIQDHGCPTEKLEKRAAMQLVDKVTVLANRMPMKDLLKSDLKNTIEHMQQAIGQTKSTAQMIHNLRNFTEYLKKPIHPLRLYQALSGNVTLDAVTVHTPESALAEHGWFFLLGMIALTKFKGVDLNRRQTPGATDDLRIGATFLRLQLQFTPDRWDAWFRLAECFDYELDEAVLWTADKMNKDRGELVKFQRNSIHCYTLALSNSHSWEPETDEDADALNELHLKFAMRLYASSREPFAMEPFRHADQERFFIENHGVGTYKKILHEEMSDYKVWKFAARLFKRAMAGRPKDWKNPYMLAKCLWKMYQKPLETLDVKDRETRPSMEAVIAALEKSIHIVSLLPKPRHGQDPILEPHYKMVAVLYKLVSRGDLSPQDAADILSKQPYAVQPNEDINVSEADGWEGLVIQNLRHLRDKDKSNWQHRIIMRHARILFDPEDTSADNYFQAKAAFSVLRESMFTKTMVMNVWKCDAERPGRHHVYTEQYVRFMVSLLVVLKDRVNLEAMLRRIRKKGADFYHFAELWATCVQQYVRLLRQTYQIPPVEEDVFKSMSPEEFEILAERIAGWVGERERDHHALNALKDAIELKKLNGGLTRAGAIDDLTNDSYSILYLDIASELPGPDPATIVEEREREKPKDGDGEMTDAPASTNGLLKPTDKDGDESMKLGSLMRPSPEPGQGEKMEKQLSNTGDHAVAKRRVVGVRRADILRKAEQAALRATEPPPKSAVSAASSGRKSRMGSTSSGKNGATTPAPEEHSGDSDADEDTEMKDDGGDGDGDGAEEQDGEEEDKASSRASSPPGTVHDDADDESDLSDVPSDFDDDQDIPMPTMFPNLRRSVEAGNVSADEDIEEGEDEDEGEGEGEAQDEDGEEIEESN
ncbi:putative transcriptional corepressor of histone genes protein [Phaeoacremonium minimum UCRPA7]|uniref:Histone transcription regulator 3 homolog n=1 Tax=Phaeoacremonium minimum (strain UCR-PA7) TaxID=1286976 RepID=R8BNM0_PHAM7|nr:putative transcriptional corepressor of histone genes protein [Phaeoacremonium minimum UCRPA7]EOO00929.1 putative transcriptional corepressor of histone genes protein [Phaeoacremonium minimum UCRPA7]